MLEETAFGTSPRRGPRTTLKVTLGTNVFFSTRASRVFCDALSALGLQRVACLDLTICGLPLVARTPPNRNRNSTQVGEWHIVTHCSTREKRAVLEQAAEMLSVPIKVEIIGPDDLVNALAHL